MRCHGPADSAGRPDDRRSAAAEPTDEATGREASVSTRLSACQAGSPSPASSRTSAGSASPSGSRPSWRGRSRSRARRSGDGSRGRTGRAQSTPGGSPAGLASSDRELADRAARAGISTSALAAALGRAVPTVSKFFGGPPSRAELLAAEIEAHIELDGRAVGVRAPRKP